MLRASWDDGLCELLGAFFIEITTRTTKWKLEGFHSNIEKVTGVSKNREGSMPRSCSHHNWHFTEIGRQERWPIQ